MRKIIFAGLLLLAGCTGSESRNEIGNAAEAPPETPVPDQSVRAPDDETPTPETADDSKSAQAAVVVIRRYFTLIQAGRTKEAADLWRDDGDAADFAAELRKLGDFRTNIAAPGRVEGAAGSLYVDISLQILKETGSALDGTAVLRRVNDVPGSTAEQRRWHIERITLQPPPVSMPTAYRFIGRWATNEDNCSNRAWRFTADSLTTPAGSVCRFSKVTEVPGGYDIAARCTAEGPPTDDMLKLRFAESARALLFESDVIADAGLVRCES